MNSKIKYLLGIAALALSTQAMAQVTFYEGVGFRGRAFTTDKSVNNLVRSGFNDRASSVVVDEGRWEVCEDVAFDGKCVVLRPGSYESLSGMGMNKRISSVRPAISKNRKHRGRDSDRNNDSNIVRYETPEPMAQPNYEYRRRPQERVFDVPVTSVHAVVGPPNERCWMEREQVSTPQSKNLNVGGAIIGAVLGGVLGHQVGEGTGKNIATAGAAVAGAAIGANVGRFGKQEPESREVRRCEKTPSTTPEYWDVTYNFRGQEHRVQMSAAPGPTIAVNESGEPRQ